MLGVLNFGSYRKVKLKVLAFQCNLLGRGWGLCEAVRASGISVARSET